MATSTIFQKPQKVKVDLDTMISQLPIGKWPSPKDLTLFHFVEWAVKEYGVDREASSFSKIISEIRRAARPRRDDSVLIIIYKENLRALLKGIKKTNINNYLKPDESDKTNKSDADEPINHLTGEGERSSQVTDRLVLNGGFDVSSPLMEVREELIKLEEERQGTLLSPHDILSINFIFTKEFMEKYFSKAGRRKLKRFFKVTETSVALSEQDLDFSKFCVEKAKASNSASEYRAFLEK
ncbi:hypothetical protein BX616_004551, partial [Lobosporangium transversale]